MRSRLAGFRRRVIGVTIIWITLLVGAPVAAQAATPTSSQAQALMVNAMNAKCERKDRADGMPGRGCKRVYTPTCARVGNGFRLCSARIVPWGGGSETWGGKVYTVGVSELWLIGATV